MLGRMASARLRGFLAIGRRIGDAGQVEQVRGLRVVELQGPGEGVQDAVRRSGEVAALETGVVVDAHAGEHRDFFAAQPGHAAVAAVRGEPGLVGGDAVPAGGQELPHFAAMIHDLDGTRRRRCREGLPVPGTLVTAARTRRAIEWVHPFPTRRATAERGSTSPSLAAHARPTVNS